MTERRLFYRKLGYLGGIVLLLVPLSMLSAPATTKSAGGKLSRLRAEEGLAQANLGKIDPASETIKLATLGLRGLAVNILWNKAHEFKKTENWTQLTATLDQLAKLQPNFISFWKFQAWNVTYNVSVEFDDYHDRYYYVIKGINFLKEGEKYNKENAKLLWDLGWFIGQKIGRADEHKEYRQLFKADDDYHPPERPREERDNWLVGKLWYDRAIETVLRNPENLGKKSPVVFFSSPAMSLMNYAEAIEKEGVFGDIARIAWKNAAEEWKVFSEEYDIKHSTGVILRMGAAERLAEQIKELEGKLDALAPGTREKIEAEQRSQLSEKEVEAFETPLERRTAEQRQLAATAAPMMQVTPRQVAEKIAKASPEKESEAMRLVREIEHLALKHRYTLNYRQTANYDYWNLRSEYEQLPETLKAREKIFDGDRAFDDSRLLPAKALYDEGFALWRIVLDKFPSAVNDSTTGDELLETIKKYRQILDQLEGELGDEFPLWDVLEENDLSGEFRDELKRHHANQPDKGGRDGDQPVPSNGSETEATSPDGPSPAASDQPDADEDKPNTDVPDQQP